MAALFEVDPEKQRKLKKIIGDIHRDRPMEQVKREFAKLIKDVSAEEIASIEQQLISEGLPVSEVQSLCDVHVSVFEKSLKRKGKTSRLPGHPIHTYMQENRESRKRLKRVRRLLKSAAKNRGDKLAEYKHEWNSFKTITRHYTRKENQLFPHLERTGFTGPSKVMWGKHDEIRQMIKEMDTLIENNDYDGAQKLFSTLEKAVKNMIFMEERILFPTAARKLSEKDWIDIKQGEPEIGYAWVTPGDLYDARMVRGLELKKEQETQQSSRTQEQAEQTAGIRLGEGVLDPDQLDMMLKALPFDITFVDETDTVRYYSATEDRIFPRSPAIIGRDVHNCHPPKSVHIVDRIIESFRMKEKKIAEFWIPFEGMLVHIRYYPLYDKAGAYRGVIEVTQDIRRIQELKGEKRLLDWS